METQEDSKLEKLCVLSQEDFVNYINDSRAKVADKGQGCRTYILLICPQEVSDELLEVIKLISGVKKAPFVGVLVPEELKGVVVCTA